MTIEPVKLAKPPELSLPGWVFEEWEKTLIEGAYVGRRVGVFVARRYAKPTAYKALAMGIEPSTEERLTHFVEVQYELGDHTYRSSALQEVAWKVERTFLPKDAPKHKRRFL